MKLNKKKPLAVRTLRIGKKRIVFLKPSLDEIKEAITKQDIRDLQKGGAILIKETKGRRKIKKKNKRSPGNIRKKVNKRKQEYVIMTRKLRKYVTEMKKQGRLADKEVVDIRKKIRNRIFRSKMHLKEYIEGLKK